MNIDNFLDLILDRELKLNFQHSLNNWKADDSTIETLEYMVGKWHGNVWFKSTEESNEFHYAWIKFKEDYIHNIGGLTLNERLYFFGLNDMWEQGSQEDHKRIRTKLKAKV